MKKPNSLVTLLEELQGEAPASDVITLKNAKAVLYLNPDVVDEEDGLSLTGDECKLLFATVDTVDRLFEALGFPDSASLCLFDLTISQPVMDVVERKFAAVDEG